MRSDEFGKSQHADFSKQNGLLLAKNFSVSCASPAMRAYFSLSPLCRICQHLCLSFHIGNYRTVEVETMADISDMDSSPC